MKTMTRILIWLFFSLWGAEVFAAVDTLNYNTAVRVLIGKAYQNISISSPENTLYVKFSNETMWHPLGKVASLNPAHFNQQKLLSINGLPQKATSLLLRGGPLPKNKIRLLDAVYRGALKISLSNAGYTVTNIISISDYLKGTIASEMNASWEIEALKAQTVTARTYAIHMVEHPKNTDYDLEKNTQDQVYTGVSAESERIDLAVDSTEGEFLSSLNKPIKAYYHSSCGGMTDTTEAVWQNKDPIYTRRVFCPYCLQSPKNWKASIKLIDIFSALKMKGTDLLSLFLHRTPSGRVSRIEIKTPLETKKISADKLRSILGYSKVKSTQFETHVSGGSLELEGKGNGHGIGMCQWGARYLAKTGQKYTEILTHYYPSAKLSNYLQNILTKN